MHYLRDVRDDEEVLSVWQSFLINHYFFSLLCEDSSQVAAILRLTAYSRSFDVFETIYSDIKRQNYAEFHGQVEANPQRFRSIVVQLIRSKYNHNFSLFIQYLKLHMQLDMLKAVVGDTDHLRRNVFHLAAGWNFDSGFFYLLNALIKDRGALNHLDQCDVYGKTPLYYFSLHCNNDGSMVGVMHLLCSIGIEFAIKHFVKKPARQVSQV